MMRCLLLLPILSVSLSASVLSDTNFINQVYLDLLGRPVDSPSLPGLLTYLETPGNTPQGLALTVLTSNDYRTDLVGSYYNAYLHRNADPGAAGFVNDLTGGATDEQVQSLILGSPEYFADQGSDNTQFIDAIFPDVLNRPAAPTDVTTWLGFLAGNTRAQMAAALLSSPEYDHVLVNDYYEAYLDRPVDSPGLMAFVPQLQGSVTNEDVQSEILGSPEFYNLAQVPPATQTPEPAALWQVSAGVALLWLCVHLRRT